MSDVARHSSIAARDNAVISDRLHLMNDNIEVQRADDGQEQGMDVDGSKAETQAASARPMAEEKYVQAGSVSADVSICPVVNQVQNGATADGADRAMPPGLSTPTPAGGGAAISDLTDKHNSTNLANASAKQREQQQQPAPPPVKRVLTERDLLSTTESLPPEDDLASSACVARQGPGRSVHGIFGSPHVPSVGLAASSLPFPFATQGMR